MSDFPGVSGIYGPLEIGVTLCTLLYGIQTFQTFHYYRNSSGDPIHLKLMVALIWLVEMLQRLASLTTPCSRFLELGQTTCNLYTNYSWSITFYGRAPQEMLIHPSRFLLLGFLFSSLSRTVIELFFANRIQVLSKNLYIVLLCLVLTISCLVGSVILVAKIWTSPLGLIFLKSKLEWGDDCLYFGRPAGRRPDHLVHVPPFVATKKSWNPI
ncbi:hypothetical protein MSAN_00940300 [Mycena sanguinolenta]|uniref:Uncharacterized protein n=1 Tax=Mycena sanguinolenta TaxID=230812 RepID=A0A8H7DA16_9AGAR|nr:hypothetical protein MSAN_00940300 [Mycena sanguinolenta]